MNSFDKRLDDIFAENLREYKIIADRAFAGLSLQINLIMKNLESIKIDLEDIKTFIKTHK